MSCDVSDAEQSLAPSGSSSGPSPSGGSSVSFSFAGMNGNFFIFKPIAGHGKFARAGPYFVEGLGGSFGRLGFQLASANRVLLSGGSVVRFHAVSMSASSNAGVPSFFSFAGSSGYYGSLGWTLVMCSRWFHSCQEWSGGRSVDAFALRRLLYGRGGGGGPVGRT